MSKAMLLVLLWAVSLQAKVTYPLSHETYERILLEGGVSASCGDLVVRYHISQNRLIAEIDNFEVPLIVLMLASEEDILRSENLIFGNQYEQCEFKIRTVDQSRQSLVGRLGCQGAVLDKLRY